MTAPVPPAGPGETVRMFVNGQAMRGGTLHAPLAVAGRLLGSIRTAARYAFFSCRDEFPGLHHVASGGWAVPGELYAVDYDVLREQLLPAEPPELELGVIQLEDGTGSLAMRYRAGVLDDPEMHGIRAIPAGVGWHDYLASLNGAYGVPKRSIGG